MSCSTLRRDVVFLLIGSLALFLATPAVNALELWADDPPDISRTIASTHVTRSVTHANGEAVPARTRPHVGLERVSDDLIRQVVYDERGEYLWTNVFEMEDGRLTSITARTDDRVRWEMRFEYDESGRPLRESYLGANGQPERTITYEYAGESAEVVAYRGDGTVSWRRSQTTGLALERRETTFFYPDGSRVKTIVARVDEDGRVLSEEHLDELGSVYRTIERSYDGNEAAEETVQNETGALIRRTTWDYDLRGLLVSRSVELPAEAVVERLQIEYTLNSRGDWIRQLKTTTAQFDDQPPIITDREILQREIEYR